MRIRAGKCRPGIQALIEVANRNMATLVASDFGFALGPRINAAGRLDDMSFGIELLLSQTYRRRARWRVNWMLSIRAARKSSRA